MPVQIFDKNKILEINNELERLKMFTFALKETIKELFLDKDDLKNSFEKYLLNKQQQLTGINLQKNISMGEVYLTKYNRDKDKKTWRITNETLDNKF